VPQVAEAEEFSACWVTTRYDTQGRPIQVTRCRIAGRNIVDYASDADVPGTLYPNLGTDLVGDCWYYTSRVTQYVILALYGDGSADLGWDPGGSGEIVAIGGRLARCTSEPREALQPVAEAWEYVTDYIHPPPAPDLNPRPGDGITGLTTYVGVFVPGDERARIAAGSTAVEVVIVVSAVVIDWGDGHTDTYPADSELLSGYPDGIAQHIYETKSADYVITVSYDWTARWRVIDDPWQFITVPNTTTSIPYPVSEIVSDLTG
jgi:hypothetical protein